MFDISANKRKFGSNVECRGGNNPSSVLPGANALISKKTNAVIFNLLTSYTVIRPNHYDRKPFYSFSLFYRGLVY